MIDNRIGAASCLPGHYLDDLEIDDSPIDPPRQGTEMQPWEVLAGVLFTVAGEALKAGELTAMDVLLARCAELHDDNLVYAKLITPQMRRRSEEETAVGKHASIPDLSGAAFEVA